MLRYSVKRILSPVRRMSRRFLGLPSMDEQQFSSLRGCIYSAAQFAARNYVAGDYLEFGVWQGDSFTKAYHAITRLRPKDRLATTRHPTHQSTTGKATREYDTWRGTRPKFYAFDSFEGLPKSTEQEIAEEWVEGAYQCSEDRFLKNLASEGVNLADVVTVRGYYDRTLTQETKQRLGLRKASIVHIDCDLYESTIVVLNFITDLIGQGTVLVFDDWFYNQGRSDMGEQRACREWLRNNPQIELIDYKRDIQSISFIVNLQQAPAQSPAGN